MRFLFLFFAANLFLHLSKANIFQAKSSCTAFDKNKSSSPSDAEGIANIWLQVGPSRTASTLQAIVLLLSAIEMCSFQGVMPVVFLYSGIDRSIQTYIKNIKFKNKLQIFKSHNVSNVAGLPEKAWIFASANYTTDELRGKKAKFVQEFSTVKAIGHKIVQEYQSVFSLTEEATERISNFMKYWEITRICCGRQMSASWRDTLHNEDNASSYVEHFCHRYNFTQIEMKLEQLSWSFGLSMADLSILALPYVISPYAGFCECTNRITKKRKLKINDPKYRSCYRVENRVNRRAARELFGLLDDSLKSRPGLHPLTKDLAMKGKLSNWSPLQDHINISPVISQNRKPKPKNSSSRYILSTQRKRKYQKKLKFLRKHD